MLYTCDTAGTTVRHAFIENQSAPSDRLAHCCISGSPPLARKGDKEKKYKEYHTVCT